MKLFSRNRYLVVEVIDEKKETESGILLPEEFKTEPRIKTAKILDSQRGGQFEYDIGYRVAFQTHLLESIEVDGVKHTLIPETAVYGVFREGPGYAPEY